LKNLAASVVVFRREAIHASPFWIGEQENNILSFCFHQPGSIMIVLIRGCYGSATKLASLFVGEAAILGLSAIKTCFDDAGYL
jgi:hypothetical protein